MRRNDLTIDERMIYMPTWERVLIDVFAIMLPMIGSIASIQL